MVESLKIQFELQTQITIVDMYLKLIHALYTLYLHVYLNNSKAFVS